MREPGPRAVRRPAIDASAPGRGGVRTLSISDDERRALLKPGAPVHVHPAYGVPTFLQTSRPGRPSRGEGPRIDPSAAIAAARAHLKRFAPLYRLSSDEVDSLAVRETHDTGRGAIVVAMQARVDGLEVFREEIKVAMDRDLQPVALSGFVIGQEGGAWNARRPARLDEADAAAIALSDLVARSITRGDLRSEALDEAGLTLLSAAPGTTAFEGLRLDRPARAKRLWLRLPDRLEPAVYVEVSAGTAGGTDADHSAYVVSAVDGALLFRHDLVSDDAFTYRVWADSITRIPMDGPLGDDPTPHPTGIPDRYQAPFVSPSLITLQNGPISTNDPWLAPGATQTSGNNVDAYADIASPNGFSAGDLRATTTSGNTFDRVYNTAIIPDANTTQRMAAVTQMFYVVNFLHDWFYDHGFNEVSGNAQASNYGRGGIQGDALRAEGQDFSGRNNANMSTPSDGGAPVMQMYIFDGIGRRKLQINAPAAIAGIRPVGLAVFGPKVFSVNRQVVLVNDGVAPATDGCTSPFVNAAVVSGRIALVDRGSCNFTVKVKNAQLNGAAGVLVANNVATGILDMGGSDATITTPSLFISLDDGDAIKGQLGAGSVDVTMVREAATDRDGTIDDQVIAHEWGHYISNRLIGNANGLVNQQGGGMGEGWGDFHSMMLTVRPEDATHPAGAGFTGVYAMAGYVTSGGGNDGGDNNGIYFGIRRYPYSIDFTKNPLTFRHIADGEPLPAGPPLEGDPTGASNSEVHNTGEVWAAMLWECYAALLRDSGRLSFDQARDRMADYLVAGYKMTPSSPTVLEARDALLAAAGAADPIDQSLFWQAFARRGAGLGAVAPDRFSTTQTGVVESFVPGNDNDADGYPDPIDCAPLASGTWSAPGEATGLDLSGHPTSLTWLAPAAPGSTTLVYDVLRSSADPGFSAPFCLETGGADLAASDPGVPGTVDYYLIRARNSCGSNLGASSSGTPHTAPPCP